MAKGAMSQRAWYLFGGMALAVFATVIWWRNTPRHKAERFLNRVAEIATVSADESEMARRVKAARLRGLLGYEMRIDVEGIVRECDLMQDDALAAWAYVVGATRTLTIEIMEVGEVTVADERLVVEADIRIESNYQRGAYSGLYPVVIELAYIQRELRVVSIVTRI